MPKLPHPSLIIFDLDNTLYDYVRPNTFATATLIEKISFQTSLNTIEVKSALDASRLNVKQRLGQTASSHNRLLYISESECWSDDVLWLGNFWKFVIMLIYKTNGYGLNKHRRSRKEPHVNGLGPVIFIRNRVGVYYIFKKNRDAVKV